MKKSSGMTRREFFAAGAGIAGVTVLSSGASARVRGRPRGENAGRSGPDRFPGRRRQEVPRAPEDRSVQGPGRPRQAELQHLRRSARFDPRRHAEGHPRRGPREGEPRAWPSATGAGPSRLHRSSRRKASRRWPGRSTPSSSTSTSSARTVTSRSRPRARIGRTAFSSPGRSSRPRASSPPAVSRPISTAACSRCRSRTPSASCRARTRRSCASSIPRAKTSGA